MTRFLLGQLSDDERKAVEERFLADDEYFAQLLAIEDSLVDDYVLGRLTADQLKNAELLFGSSAIGKREVTFTQDLVASLRKAREAKEQKKKRAQVTNQIASPKTSPWLRSQVSVNLIARGFRSMPGVFSAALGLTLLLLVGASIFLFFQYQRRTRELLAQRVALERNVQETRAKLDQQMRTSAELSKQLDLESEMRTQAEEALAQFRNGGSRSITPIVLLPTTFQRSGGTKTVSFNPGSTRLQLLLEIPSDTTYPNYNVLIKTLDGPTFWSRDSISASQVKQRKLSLILSSSFFPDNDYRIELLGVPDNGAAQLVADYAFKVRKQ